MRTRLITGLALLVLGSVAARISYAVPVVFSGTALPDGKAHRFAFGGTNNSEFLLDGQTFQIRCGEMHPTASRPSIGATGFGPPKPRV